MRKRNLWILWAVVLANTILSIVSDYFSSNNEVAFGLSIVVFITTVYYYYLQCTFQGGLKRETGEGREPWGHFWLGIFTLGFYWIYWYYAAGKRLAKLGAKDRSILYLVAVILCFIVIDTSAVLIFLQKINFIDNFSDNLLFMIIRGIADFIYYLPFIHMQYTANKLIDGRANAAVNTVVDNNAVIDNTQEGQQ